MKTNKSDNWIQFVDKATQESLVAPHKRIFTIGRNDDGLSVDIDTTPVGGYRKGVSRKHLQIQVSSGRVFAFDISSYGTAINGRPMIGEKAYPISDGDQLLLGTLHLQVQIDN